VAVILTNGQVDTEDLWKEMALEISADICCLHLRQQMEDCCSERQV